MKETLLFTVIFPIIIDYLDDYIHSIIAQTDQRFDWLIINDGIKDYHIREKFPSNVIWKDVNENYKPAELRYLGSKYALANNYEILIFADGDDYFTHNRIELTKKYLMTNDFVFNELYLVDETGIELQPNVLQRIFPNSNIDSINMLLDNNIVGLSNSALNLTCIDNIYMPKEIIAVDWWLYSVLVLNGKKGELCPSAITYYRQTGNNTVGMWTPLTSIRLFKGIEVKKIHFHHLKEYAATYMKNNAYYRIFDKKYGEMLILEEALQRKEFCTRYTRVINNNFDQIYKGWWSEILPLEQWRQYAE